MAVPNRLVEMEQLQNEMKERRRVLNFLLRSVRTRDPAEREERINAARDNLKEREKRIQIGDDVSRLSSIHGGTEIDLFSQ